MARQELLAALMLTSLLILATILLYWGIHQNNSLLTSRKITYASHSSPEKTKTRSIHKINSLGITPRKFFRSDTSRNHAAHLSNFPKSPFTLIVPSDSVCKNQIFIKHLAASHEYAQIEHLLRGHFLYKKTKDIEVFRDKNYPFWYCIDNDGKLYYMDGKEVSPHDFIVKQHHALSSIMVVEGLNTSPCDEPGCYFLRTQQNNFALMTEDESVHLSIDSP